MSDKEEVKVYQEEEEKVAIVIRDVSSCCDVFGVKKDELEQALHRGDDETVNQYVEVIMNTYQESTSDTYREIWAINALSRRNILPTHLKQAMLLRLDFLSSDGNKELRTNQVLKGIIIIVWILTISGWGLYGTENYDASRIVSAVAIGFSFPFILPFLAADFSAKELSVGFLIVSSMYVLCSLSAICDKEFNEPPFEEIRRRLQA